MKAYLWRVCNVQHWCRKEGIHLAVVQGRQVLQVEKVQVSLVKPGLIAKGKPIALWSEPLLKLRRAVICDMLDSKIFGAIHTV